MKRYITMLIAVIIAVILASCALVSPKEAARAKINGEMTAHFIDVGQGDSILLESKGEYVLIDAGEFDYGDTVLSYIKDLGAKSVKYVIATHPHLDHAGGLRTVINNIRTENFITTETDSDTSTWTKLLKAVDELNINYIDAKVGDTYSFGSSEFTIMGPVSDSYEGYNGYSVVVKAVCGDISMLLTGDAEILNEKEMLDAGEDLSADLLKCGHHGSSNATCTRFLQAVDPAFAVITCGKSNEYGHPHKQTKEKLELLGCPYYTTADCGTITASTDGKSLSLSSSDGRMRSDVYKAGEPKNTDSRLSFIGNKSSLYFHDPTCDTAKSISPENKIEIDTYEQALKSGYKPCQACNP